MALTDRLLNIYFDFGYIITELMVPSKQQTSQKQPIQLQKDRENLSVLRKICDFSLNQLRHSTVFQVIKDRPIKRVLDVGCNTGQFIRMLSRSPKLELVAGMDCEQQSVLKAIGNAFPEMIQSSIQFDRENDLKVLIYKGDLTKEYSQIKNLQFEVITMIEVIQHLPLDIIPQASQILFGFLRPPLIIITTPNKEFNIHFGSDPNTFRHWDHKFEWTRLEFQVYCESIKEKYGYSYQIKGIGEHVSDASLGCCTQMTIFSLQNSQQQLQFQYVDSIEEKQFQEGNFELQLRAEYTMNCWKSKLNHILLGLFYTGLSYKTEETFDSLLEYIQVASLLSQSMHKNGQQLTVFFLKKSISQFEQFFEWDQQKYWIKKNKSEDMNSQLQQHQKQIQLFLASSPFLGLPECNFQDSNFSVSASVFQPIQFQQIN